MSEFVPPSGREMSARLRALTAPSQALNSVIFRTMEEVEGDVWSDLIASEDGVWMRRDPEDGAAWDVARDETGDFEVALARKLPSVRLVCLSEQTGPDASHPWRCELAIPPSLRAEPFVGLGANPAIALQDANFQIHGFLRGEKE